MRICLFILTATALVVTAACGQDSNSSTPANTTSNSTSSLAPTTASGPSPLQLPNVPAGQWGAAGDLCKIITGSMAAEVLGYTGTLSAKYSSTSLPVQGGIDACVYTAKGASKGTAAILSVMKATDKLWSDTRKEVDAAGKVQDFTIAGVDGAFVSQANQAFARKGNIMASALNSSLGKFDAAGLAKLTALAASVV